MERKQPKVSIVMLSYNTEDYTIQALKSMKDTDYNNYEIILIDNGSEEKSRINLRMFLENFEIKNKITYKEISPNQGFSGGCNIGIYEVLQSNSDYVLLLNNDIKIIRGNWLKLFVESAEVDEKIGIVGCKLIYPDGGVQHAGAGVNMLGPYNNTHENVDETRKCDYVTGAALLIKKEVIEKIGFLDEEFLRGNYEDIDFCFRAKKTGYKIIYAADITIIHYESKTMNRREETQKILYNEKNRMMFKLLNFPIYWFVFSIPYEILHLRVLFFKKDKHSRLKVKIRDRDKILSNLLLYFPKVLWPNIKNIWEIVNKRMDRTKFINSEKVRLYLNQKPKIN